MNVYDFDHTIYRGDSTVDFWRYCLSKYPKSVVTLPLACIYGVAFKLHLCSRERFKKVFYRFLRYVPNTRNAVERFWDSHEQRVEEWYLRQKQDDDLIISASPEFLIRPVCDRLGVRCIASEVAHNTGKLLGANCRGAEKLRLLRNVYPEETIDEFYSDSKSDIFLARVAQRAFLVNGEKRKEWRV